MKIFYCDHFELPLPPGHRFPMEKYRLLRERVAASSFVAEGDLRAPAPASDLELATVHEPAYLTRVLDGTLAPLEIRRIGFPWSAALVERSRRSVGGTLEAARAALRDGRAVNLAGGTHHAFPERGEGFCVFNDVAVAVRVLQNEREIGRAVVLDLDVHQGNGTAAVFQGDPSVVTLSVHGANNFPFRKVNGDIDIELPDQSGDEAYLRAVEEGLERALIRPGLDLAFFVAGADPFVGDRLGRLAVTKAGLLARDRLVFQACAAREIPVAVVMGGGYASPVEDTVDIHFATVRCAAGWAGS